ncbi:MAG TPA: NUDIX hydrolase [Flavisolibacter sp.]
MEWKVVESEKLFSAPWLNVRKDVCELPDGRRHSDYYILEYPDWATAFALTEDNKVVLVRQYRHGLGVISTELPGGVIDNNEHAADAVARELMEETGYQFDSIEEIGKVSPNPATSTNYMHMFLAKGGKKVAEQNLDATEDVEVLIYSIDELKQLIRENKMVQSLHVTTAFYALERLGLLNY